MAGDAIELGEDDAHRLRARRSFYVENLLDREAVTQAVGDRGHIIHAVDIRVELGEGAVFGDLLHTAVQVSDDAIGPQDLLAIQFEDDAQHSVGGRVLRTHIEDQLSGI